MSTLKTTNLQHASAASPAIVLASDGTAAAQVSSLNGGPLSGARNRIINGDMRIDQRNAGASVSPMSGSYAIDRWVGSYLGGATGRFSAQQSSTAPAGFTKSWLITVTTADAAPSSIEGYEVQQWIEGNNIADLGFGTANASPITVSFWVRSSLTGTFPLIVYNWAGTRAFGGTYTINSANTWEYKAVTISGDTSGTWATDNTAGLAVIFGFGGGSGRTLSAGWQGASGSTPTNVTGCTSLIATNGATFYITGVQLEAGSVATPFERRSYGQELALCERYYQVGIADHYIYYNGSATLYGSAQFRTKMRATPSSTSITSVSYYGNGISASTTTLNADGVRILIGASAAGLSGAQTTFDANAEL